MDPNDPPQRWHISGAVRRRIPFAPEDAVTWRTGIVVTDGFVQRYIHDLHADFADDDRIPDGPFVLMEIPVGAVPESEWEIDEEKAEEYARRPSLLPPGVLSEDLGFVDGGHRHKAAQVRGDLTFRAFVPAAIAHRFNN